LSKDITFEPKIYLFDRRISLEGVGVKVIAITARKIDPV